MYSFYGGHPGSSINIVKIYSTINSLETDFKNQSNVKYGQCASIISSDSHNGEIYQKLYNGNALLIGKFSATLKTNYITKAIVTDQNHLLIKYSDSDQQGDIIYNNEDGWTDLGDVSLNITLNIGQYYSNLNWCGIGIINRLGVIKFTLPLSRPLHNETSLITTSAGSITIKNKNNDIIIDNFSLSLTNSNKITINENILGLDFVINTNQILNEISEEEIINIIISGLTLRIN